ncbi:MAG: hypothetical protein E4H36_06720 [Spirochaetales bacterium]|nr:MAG: hypothetical protein E4H36_06720 [Spirochaetales bacterium]
MRRIRLTALFLLGTFILPLAVFPDIKKDFDSVVDFSVTMKNIQQVLKAPGGLDNISSKLLVLSGSVASIQFLSAEGEDFVAAVELVSGEWIGVEDVRLFKAYLVVTGPQFAERLPVRRSREALENEIVLNSQILAVGRIVDFDTSESEYIPIIECFYIREL